MTEETPDSKLIETSSFKSQCFHDCKAKLLVGEERTELLVCKEHLSKISEYFQRMFFGDFKEKNQESFKIKDEKPEDMICFFNAIDPNPNVNEITEDSVELLMCLADRFQCDLLRERLKYYIQINEPNCKSGSTLLNWLIWSVLYNMPEETFKVCLPGVACLPLSTLLENQQKIGLALSNKLINAKFDVFLRAAKFRYLCLEKGKSNASQLYECNSCGVKEGFLPFRFCLNSKRFGAYESIKCNICALQICNNSYSSSSGCGIKIRENGYYSNLSATTVVDCTSHYYKCARCSDDITHYKSREQCLCARKNYEAWFNM